MDENNRKILVEQQKAKATRFIKQAEEMLDRKSTRLNSSH